MTSPTVSSFRNDALRDARTRERSLSPGCVGPYDALTAAALVQVLLLGSPCQQRLDAPDNNVELGLRL